MATTASKILYRFQPAFVMLGMFGFVALVFVGMFAADHFAPYTPPATSSISDTDVTPNRPAPVTGIMGSRSVIIP